MTIRDSNTNYDAFTKTEVRITANTTCVLAVMFRVYKMLCLPEVTETANKNENFLWSEDSVNWEVSLASVGIEQEGINVIPGRIRAL